MVVINMFALFVVFLFFVVVALLFLKDVIAVAVNITVLFALFSTTKKELKKKWEVYVLCFILAACILTITGNFLPLWFVTSTAILAFIGVKIYELRK